MAFIARGAPSQHRRACLVVLAALAISVLGSGCGRRPPVRGQALPPGAVVLALGDSITLGTGAPAAAAYPAQLAAISGWSVVNAGVAGDTSEGALARLPSLLVEHRPALVIVSIGGNDFLRRLDEAGTEARLRRIVTLCRGAGAQVLLVAVPRPTVVAALGAGLSDHPMYARVADELHVPLHADGWSAVLGDEKLRSDAIHANAAGYRVFVEGLLASLRAAGLIG
jgi:lysophospholipase L1-like esterase